MKVIVYHISEIDKQFLALANHKRHKITIINVPLDETTVYFAQTKDVVIITGSSSISSTILKILINLGVRYIITWFKDPFNCDLPEIKNGSLQCTSVRNADSSDVFEIINILNNWQKNDDDHP